MLKLYLVAHLFTAILGNELTQATIDDIQQQIRQMIDDDPIGLEARNKRMIGGLVRLSFHDCVGPRCDGCINIENPENAGLETYIDRTEQLYTDLEVDGVKVDISRADFWALAGIEAVMYSNELATCQSCTPHLPNITFYLGREDCSTSPFTDVIHEFPSALGDSEHVVEFFDKQFGFDEKETTAILGAHTLGKAHSDASGFPHRWVNRENRLTNDFYIDLKNSDKGWFQKSTNKQQGELWFWENDEGEEISAVLMLNADMALIKNLSSADANGEVECTFETCADVNSDTLSWVDAFADDNNLWIDEFSKAFQKMIGHGWEGKLSDPKDSTSATTESRASSQTPLAHGLLLLTSLLACHAASAIF